MKKLTLCLLVNSLLILNNSFSQTQKIIADKIIAHIGNKIILRSDVEPGENCKWYSDADPQCKLLEQQLINKCLMMEAIKDSITLNEDEITALVDEYLREAFQSNTSLHNKEAIDLKQKLFDAFTERNYADAMRRQILGKITVTPAEVKSYFESLPPDSIPFVESIMHVSQIVIYPQQSKEMEQCQVKQLLEWKRQVETGKQKFDVLAKLYSQDPGSNTQGGVYSITRNDKQWDAAWFSAIWELKEGQISPLVHSKYGLHIIQLVSRAGNDAVIRHIMLAPQVTTADINNTKNLLDSVRSLVLAGRMTFGSAVRQYSQDDETKGTGGQVISIGGSTAVTYDDIDKDAVLQLRKMKPGYLSQPSAYKDEMQRTAVRIIFLQDAFPAHKARFESDYTYIASQALEKKKAAVLQHWLALHMHDFYVSINNDYLHCSNIAQWVPVIQAASKKPK
ncbi:MAG TPA: peptidylprolyl isomerase [Chitinophagaceae bacterium]|nr:peptidylprolyl isomerase [Chitinophagaceae bacterium]